MPFRISLYLPFKNVTQYLRATKDWGIQFCRPIRNDDNELIKSKPPEEQQQVDKLLAYLEPITNGKHIGFVYVAYSNDLSK